MSAQLQATIIVKYSCDPCGIRRRAVVVPERDPHEDVLHYVEQIIGERVAADHRAVSPQCRSSTMSELMIPYDKDADYVGQPRKQ